MKYVITSIIIIFSSLYVTSFIDDQINPEIERLTKEYNRPLDLDNNVYIELIRLGSKMSYSESLELYYSTLRETSKDPTKSGSEFLYPSIENFASYEELKIVCKLKSIECLEDIKSNKKKYKKIIKKFKNILSGYRALGKLDNFTPINSFYSEPNFEILANLNQLATLEIYIDILDDNNEIALSKLASMIKLDRKFLATSHEFIFDILPIVNMSARYAPLILALKNNDTQGLEELVPLLMPLSIDELSLNRSFESFFVFGTELLKLPVILVNNNEEASSFNLLFAKQRYKENMTINADYQHLKRNLIPTNLSKSKLLDYLKLRKVKNDSAIEHLMEKPFFSIDNIRNPVGEIMLQIKTPKFVHIFEEKIGLDLTIILTRILVLSGSRDLNALIESGANQNPYKDEKAFINQEGLLCFSTSKPVCIRIK